jgi:pyruvate dehydrogenase (quinone)/pyruvate oxidase
VDDPAKCGSVLDAAFATPGPVLIEAVVDPYEPPMPPQATLEQTYEFAKALVRGQPDGGKIISTILKDKVKEMV